MNMYRIVLHLVLLAMSDKFLCLYIPPQSLIFDIYNYTLLQQHLEFITDYWNLPFLGVYLFFWF